MKAPKSLVLGGLDMMLLESVSESYRERVERNFKPSNSESGGRDKQEIPARCCYYTDLVTGSWMVLTLFCFRKREGKEKRVVLEREEKEMVLGWEKKRGQGARGDGPEKVLSPDSSEVWHISFGQ